MQYSEAQNTKMTGFQKTVTFLLAAILLCLILFMVIYTKLNTNAFVPVKLSNSENTQLQQKLSELDNINSLSTSQNTSDKLPPIDNQTVRPEAYSESNAMRHIQFTERELNALLANNTDLAKKVAIDLSTNLASANILIPLDPEFPILGGKTLKLNAGLDLRFANDRPVVKLVGVSLWGVPIPNAWLGGLKNIDLIDEFGTESGFWKAFADGINELKVENESLLIELKE